MIGYLVFGSRLFGKTDEVPGLFHVATAFWHIWFFPLYPIRSHLVFEESWSGWEGVPLTLHPKSLLLGYARALLVVMCIPTLIIVPSLVASVLDGRYTIGIAYGLAWMLVSCGGLGAGINCNVNLLERVPLVLVLGAVLFHEE